MASIDIILSSAAANNVEHGTNGKAAAHDPAENHVLWEGQWCAENVEQALDPERVYKGTVLHDVSLSDYDAQEEQAEESVVSRHNDFIEPIFSITDAKNWEQNGQCAESNSYRVKKQRLC